MNSNVEVLSKLQSAQQPLLKKWRLEEAKSSLEERSKEIDELTERVAGLQDGGECLRLMVSGVNGFNVFNVFKMTGGRAGCFLVQVGSC